MAESPTAGIRGKPDSPIVRANQDQKSTRVHAVVSAGSTGAMVAASLLILGRLPSVDRPAIGTLVPTVTSHLLLLDAGANVQCSPEHLLSFAIMGNLFAKEMFNLPQPRVGLLNIGEEETKGPDLVISTYKLLKNRDINFIGNIESNRLLLGEADVVVTDGFTGNMVLKLLEGFGHYMAGLAQNEDLTEEKRQALLPALAILQERFSYENYGGALLLGINGVSIISHGRSTSRAITNAVLSATRMASLDIPAKLQATLSSDS
jgi:glycerol-3-phosphate acyltransferase PlsX